jgi:hypothetical protein
MRNISVIRTKDDGQYLLFGHYYYFLRLATVMTRRPIMAAASFHTAALAEILNNLKGRVRKKGQIQSFWQ